MKKKALFVTALIVAFSCLLLCACSNSTATQADSSTSASDSANQSSSPNEASEPDVIVTEQSVTDGGGDEYITTRFTVMNNTDEAINTLTLYLYEMDESGNMVSETYPQVPGKVDPGNTIVVDGIHKASEVYKVQPYGYSYYTGKTTDGEFVDGYIDDAEILSIQ